MTEAQMRVGGRYNWRSQPERLIYLGRNWSGNGYWHQFARVGEPEVVWCEVTGGDISRLEETVEEIELPTPPGIERGYDRHSHISTRQQRKARKADRRVPR